MVTATARRKRWSQPLLDAAAAPAAGVPAPLAASSFALDLAAFQATHLAAAVAFRQALFECAELSDGGADAPAHWLKCDFCPRTFATRRGLKRHRYNCRLHFLERGGEDVEEDEEDAAAAAADSATMWVPCDLCNKRCRTKRGYTRHRLVCSVKHEAGTAAHEPSNGAALLLAAEAGGSFSCDLCARAFTTERGLKRHRHACAQQLQQQQQQQYPYRASGHIAHGIIVDATLEPAGTSGTLVNASVVGADGAAASGHTQPRHAVLDAVVVSVEAANPTSAVVAGHVVGHVMGVGMVVDEADDDTRHGPRGAHAGAARAGGGADEQIDAWCRRQIFDMMARGEMTLRDVALASGIVPSMGKAGDVHLNDFLHGKHVGGKQAQEVRGMLLRWFEERDSTEDEADVPGASATPSRPRAHFAQPPLQPHGPNGVHMAPAAVLAAQPHAFGVGAGGPNAPVLAMPWRPSPGVAGPTVATAVTVGCSSAGSGGAGSPNPSVVVGVPVAIGGEGGGAGGGNQAEQRRRLWSTDEDNRLRELVALHGQEAWPQIAQHFSERLPRQCRMRYVNYLAPGISHDEYSPEEDARLLAAVAQMGEGHWARLAAQLPGRRPDSVRNRWRLLSGTCRSTDGVDAAEQHQAGAPLVVEAQRAHVGAGGHNVQGAVRVEAVQPLAVADAIAPAHAHAIGVGHLGGPALPSAHARTVAPPSTAQ